MRIKRVVIQGFKTFARRTEFVFDPGVTAVVGPNGSGKSNIVDAVRWCLGEQSFSLLRSRKTSDVIFSGSDKKARLNLAEVTMTLDNSAGEIPIDFAEIEVTRRAYRDGDNEYIVNGQRVRLQDIVDLLAQTGLGKRTYSVIGQGLIDRALSMAPEERRSLFEEAAGISGYQIKRATAVRRLEATKQNLTRVQDIVAELSPRLSYLRRQAERAQEREQIASDLQSLLRDWYGFCWHTMLHTVKTQHSAEQALRKAAEQRQTELTHIGRAIERARAMQTECRTRLATLHAEGSEMHRQAERIGRELAVAQERLRQLQSRCADSERELAPLTAQRSALVARLEELHATLQAAQFAVSERQQAAEAVQIEVGQRQQERARLEAQQDDLRRDLARCQQQRAAVESRLRQISERRTVLTSDYAQQQAALTAAEQDAQRAESALTEVQSHATQLEEEAQSVQRALQALEQSIAGSQQSLRAAEAQRQSADLALDRLRTRQEMLQRLQREGAGYGGGVRAVLQAGSSQRLRGIIGTVASQVRVPAKLDKAIEMALGGALQNVITIRWEDAAAAIEMLKEQRSGRATFLPLDRLHVQPALVAPNRRGLLGSAVDLIDYDPVVEAAVQHLLNRVWVAEDLPAARAALDDFGSGARPTLVTLDGEIIRPGGAVTGGNEGGRSDESLLARARELRELPGQIEVAAAAADRQAEACTALTAEMERQRIEVSRQRQLLADLARQDRLVRTQMEELRRQVDRSVQAQRWRSEQIELTQAEQRTLDERAVSLVHELDAVQAAEATAAVALDAIGVQVAAAGADTLMQELANRRTAAAEAQGHLRSQQGIADSTTRNLQSLTDQVRHKEQQIAGLAGEIESLAARVAVLGEQEEDLSRQIDSLQQRINPLEEELARLETEQGRLEHQERPLQNLLRQEESLWNHAVLQLQRGEDSLYQLRSEIEQDFGLVRLEGSEEIAYQPPLPWESLVEQLPVHDSVPETMESEVSEMRARLARLSNVNPDAPREYEEAAERYEFLFTQSEDLEAASADLQKVIKELDDRMEIELRRTYDAVGKEFTQFFQKLFNGGTAHLELTDPENISQSGVEIIARPPGKRPQNLALLSGGERSLAACALIFAILHVSPTPFCVLDEVDAALDEANVDRFRTTVEELSEDTQFIIVTHNRRTLEGANTIYGITMGNDGISRSISLRLEGDRMVKHDESADSADLQAISQEIQL